MANLGRSLSFGRKVVSPRVVVTPTPTTLTHRVSRKNGISCCFLFFFPVKRLKITVICVLLLLGGLYHVFVFVSPHLEGAVVNLQGDPFAETETETETAYDVVEECDVFSGRWVRDERDHPLRLLYNSTVCPFAERGFDCLANGRIDDDYLRWRWKPRNCNIPRFDAKHVLQRLQGRKIVFVGDSMGRTQWESLICQLMTGVEDEKSVYEINGNNVTKTIRFLGVKFSSFNLTVDFYRSPFLVQAGIPPRKSPKRVRSTLQLDRLDDISKIWIDSDYIIFNSGHWWSPTKLFDIGCYFQIGKSVRLGLQISTAYRIAMSTWASWVQGMVNTKRTRVFFRTFEPSHWSDDLPEQRSCSVSQYPLEKADNFSSSSYAEIISEVIAEMNLPVVLFNITSMSASRSDAHVGNWTNSSTVEDCSHWCLPGVPDAWNQLLLTLL